MWRRRQALYHISGADAIVQSLSLSCAVLEVDQMERTIELESRLVQAGETQRVRTQSAEHGEER
jgi:hypothetical protein